MTNHSRRGSLRGLALLLILVATSAPGAARAQDESAPPHVEAPGGMQEVDGASPVAKRLFADLVCLCGGCKRETLLACTCGFAKQEREKVLGMLAGMDLTTEAAQEKAYIAVRDAIIKENGGQHVLTVPIDAGFNRLAWIVPWAVFGLALTLVLVVGRRWVARGRAASAAALAAGGSVLGGAVGRGKPDAAQEEREDRLDDELRDID